MSGTSMNNLPAVSISLDMLHVCVKGKRFLCNSCFQPGFRQYSPGLPPLQPWGSARRLIDHGVLEPLECFLGVLLQHKS